MYSIGNFVPTDPLLGLSHTGTGSPSNPFVYSYAFEFTESQAITLNLPDLSTTKSMTCYMTAGALHRDTVSSITDLTSASGIFGETSAIGISIDNDTNTSDILDTSDAMDLIGKRTVLALLAWIGLMAFH